MRICRLQVGLFRVLSFGESKLYKSVVLGAKDVTSPSDSQPHENPATCSAGYSCRDLLRSSIVGRNHAGNAGRASGTCKKGIGPLYGVGHIRGGFVLGIDKIKVGSIAVECVGGDAGFVRIGSAGVFDQIGESITVGVGSVSKIAGSAGGAEVLQAPVFNERNIV